MRPLSLAMRTARAIRDSLTIVKEMSRRVLSNRAQFHSQNAFTTRRIDSPTFDDETKKHEALSHGERTMAELVVVGFEGKHRAAEVLDQLEVLNAYWAIDLKDAVAVYRTDDGKLRFDRSVQPTTG